jgi:hypothetical protein
MREISGGIPRSARDRKGSPGPLPKDFMTMTVPAGQGILPVGQAFQPARSSILK